MEGLVLSHCVQLGLNHVGVWYRECVTSCGARVGETVHDGHGLVSLSQ